MSEPPTSKTIDLCLYPWHHAKGCTCAVSATPGASANGEALATPTSEASRPPEQRTSKPIGATFVEDMADRWIVIECLDFNEKKRIVEVIRRALAGGSDHSSKESSGGDSHRSAVETFAVATTSSVACRHPVGNYVCPTCGMKVTSETAAPVQWCEVCGGILQFQSSVQGVRQAGKFINARQKAIEILGVPK